MKYIMMLEHRPDQVLTPIEADPRYGRLLALQLRESSELSVRHADERLRLTLDIRREEEQ